MLQVNATQATLGRARLPFPLDICVMQTWPTESPLVVRLLGEYGLCCCALAKKKEAQGPDITTVRAPVLQLDSMLSDTSAAFCSPIDVASLCCCQFSSQGEAAGSIICAPHPWSWCQISCCILTGHFLCVCRSTHRILMS